MYDQTHFDVVLPASAFHPNGYITRQDDGFGYAYVEEQKAKNTYFVWDPIKPEDEARIFGNAPQPKD